MGGNLNSALSGAVTGAISGGIGGYFGNNYSLRRVGAEAVSGGVNARINGGKFSDGFKFSLGISLMTYGSYEMRRAAVENSSQNSDNINGQSEGMFGDGKKLAGARRIFDPETGRYLVCQSLMGGCQGAPSPGTKDVRSSFFGIEYQPGSWMDKVNESFAGPHDWLRNLTGSYEANGNSRYFTGFRGFFDDYVANYGLVLPAAPFAAASLVPSNMYEPLRRGLKDQ